MGRTPRIDKESTEPDIVQWLQKNDIFKLHSIEKLVQLPAGYLSKEMSGKRMLQQPHIRSLEQYMAQYGFKMKRKKKAT